MTSSKTRARLLDVPSEMVATMSRQGSVITGRDGDSIVVRIQIFKCEKPTVTLFLHRAIDLNKELPDKDLRGIRRIKEAILTGETLVAAST